MDGVGGSDGLPGGYRSAGGMFRRAYSNGHADSDFAAHRHSRDRTRADCGTDCGTDCDPCGCIFTDAGAYRQILARAGGNPGIDCHSHVCAYVHAGTNPDCCGARG